MVRFWGAALAIVLALLAACSGGAGTADPTQAEPGAMSASAAPTQTMTPPPPTRLDRIRAVIRSQDPDPDEIVELAGSPFSWTTGNRHVLVRYDLRQRPDWWTPHGISRTVARLLDDSGRAVAQWIEPRTSWGFEYHSVARGFVAADHGGYRPVLIDADGPTPLKRLRGSRPWAPGDERVGHGWLLDRSAGTLTPERLPGCRSGSIRIDERRVWCLDGPKRTLSWSDDGGTTWSRHPLSMSYLEACDGGEPGAEIELLGDVVAIGLWRADVSRDRGRTWQSVPLPVDLIGAGPTPYEANCTDVEPLVDGRLVIGYRRTLVATDSTNTAFAPVREPPKTRFPGVFFGVEEGVLLATSRHPYGGRVVSYDGGATWRPIHERELVRHLLAE